MREVCCEAATDRIERDREHDWNCLRLAGKGVDYDRVMTEDHVGSQIDQLFCEFSDPIRITGAPAKFDPEIATFRPSKLRKRAPESRK
jgi:hypothetical protein